VLVGSADRGIDSHLPADQPLGVPGGLQVVHDLPPDTFDVRSGEVWEVAFRAANPCVWMNHCHNLAHADQGMAMHLRYEGVTSPFHGGHGG
jgi:FtsP/CotA-like multicopper oxidase with cupredoxin domain